MDTVLKQEVWLLTRTPNRHMNGLKLSLWDSDTGLARQGEVIGYAHSKQEIDKIRERYQRHGRGYWYRYMHINEIK